MLQFHQEAIKSIMIGTSTVARILAVTLGPAGQKVAICKEFCEPILTQNSLVIAKEIALQNRFENMGAQVIKEAAFRTKHFAGDGSVISVVLAEAIYREGVQHLLRGVHPYEIKKEIERASFQVCQILEACARSEDLQAVSMTAAHQDSKISDIILQALQRSGYDGIVTVCEAQEEREPLLDIKDGVQFEGGYLSPYFATPTGTLDFPFIFIANHTICSFQDIGRLLEQAASKFPLLIIADDIQGEALQTLIMNKIKNNMPICAVKTPVSLQPLRPLIGDQQFIRVKQAKITKETTTIFVDTDSQIRTVTIHVGKEKKSQVEAALESTRSAVIHGAVAGGGIAFLRAVKKLKGQSIGDDLMRRVCMAPATRMAYPVGKRRKRKNVFDSVFTLTNALNQAVRVAGSLLNVAVLSIDSEK